MTDEVIREFPGLRRGGFTSENQPDHAARGEKVRAMNSVKAALMNAQDKLGNEAVFLELWRGNPDYRKLPPVIAAKLLAEDRRVYANIVAKLLPIEVQGALDGTLIVKVVTQMGSATAHDITRARTIREDAVPLPAPIPVPQAVDRDLRE